MELKETEKTTEVVLERMENTMSACARPAYIWFPNLPMWV